MFENRLLRTSLRKREEVTGGGRKLHNEEVIIYTLVLIISVLYLLYEGG
jgi:hypothetical protein